MRSGNNWVKYLIDYINSRCDYNAIWLGQVLKSRWEHEINKLANHDGENNGENNGENGGNDQPRINNREITLTGSDETIYEFIHLVKTIETVDDQSYDQLLTKNIVFLDLIDASAVNTIIECVVRLTPIIINRIPATVEILGEDYPLFYDRIEDVPLLLSLAKISSAHTYLKHLPKDNLRLENFVAGFLEQ